MSNRILITGKDSYVGNSFSEYALNMHDIVDIVDTIGDEWKKTDFSMYDTVVHVAAIVHKQEKEFSRDDYFKVNSQLTYDIAKKARDSGVKQFVFLSTMSVYGVVNGVISKDTPPNPVTLYGASKLKAEQMIQELNDDSFSVVILRPPIIYGKGCKGNYVTLSQFAKKLPIFPDYKSQRSMIYIGNLNSFIKKAIAENMTGVFCPQDESYVTTSQMVKLVAQANKKNIKLIKIFNPFITLAIKLNINIICKVFGTLVYDDSLKLYYDRVDLKTAIKMTEE